jgi:phosphatidylinositol glycan class Q protein
VRNVEHALRMRSLFRGSRHPIDNVLNRCGGQPIQVLGTLNAAEPVKTFDPKLLSLSLVGRRHVPAIECSAQSAIIIQIITFDRPNPKRMEYLSLTPISLALGDKRGAFGSVAPFDQIDKEEELEKIKKEKLVEKLKQHTVIQHSRTPKELALPKIIEQINCSAELNALMQQNIGLVGVRTKRSLSVSERVVNTATNLWDLTWIWLKQIFIHHIWPFASQVFIRWIMVLRIIAEGILTVLDWRPFGHAALKDISATAQQVDIRLQQFCYWPPQYLTLRRRRNDWESITNSHPEYIRFFNSLWLVANDIIIGIALGAYILENVDFVASSVDKNVTAYAIEGLQRMLAWLMDYPAGLKLNNELATFLGDLFLWVIDYWSGCMLQLRPALPVIIRIIGISSFAGASLPISLFSDLLSLLTVHIYCFYMASARIYNWQLTIIISLFHLFRGKKRNILRNRIDSCDYDLDQLLLGTILFTLLFFLLPTVAVFYATFAGARMTIIALKAALDTWLAVLNHFPLFALMLRIKDSRRLPGGIRFELQQTNPPTLLSRLGRTPSPPTNTRPANGHTRTPSMSSAPTAYIKLKSVPLPLSQTMSQYAQLGQRIRKHYLSPRVFLRLVSGQFVPPIHRKNLYSLQYSMLPVQRVSMGELWEMMSAALDTTTTKTGGVGGAFGGRATNGYGGGSAGFAGVGRLHPNSFAIGARKREHIKKGEGYWWSK